MATKKKSGLTQSVGDQTGEENGSQSSGRLFDPLRDEHRQLQEAISKYEKVEAAEGKLSHIEKICVVWTRHTVAEEAALESAASSQPSLRDDLEQFQVKRDLAKILARELLNSPPNSAYFDAKIVAFLEQVKRLIEEEEKADGGLFAKVEAAGADADELQKHIEATRQLFDREGENIMPVPVSLRTHSAGERTKLKEVDDMNRNYERDRDERGRFVSNDDDRYERREYSSRSRGDRDNDDDRGSYRGRRYEEDDRYGRGSQGRWDDDYERRGRSRDDDRGWYGDREGHAQASRRGWDERRSTRYPDDDRYARQSRSRYEDDDDDRSHRGRGWYGDPEGHSQASRRGWEEREGYSRSRRREDDDDDRRESYGRRHGGWSGDPEGHAEAARRGWENRR